MPSSTQHGQISGPSLTDQVIDALPDWITHLIQINSLVADRMGLVVTDFHCLHVLQQDGPTTTGALANRVGLTPGAASRMVDRLVAAGCVKRVSDAADRRRVLVEATDEGLERANAHYAGLTARTREDLAAFGEDQLRALLQFIRLSECSALAEVRRLRAER
ncbi:MarR family winged helix-turn-helix transcriptional regulator [Micromonospora sp. KC213]|uniref:MarR family winged helix-turn-helix transcriptional regulator n=1 Tax=Micromonospora sp. KC213 TaxID=2530378 RepID=UPI0010510289|nr:MarR family winged helix-turn-helix transcriptional regulator [Micromonospora sp. KC213]TDC40907.1 MarR family transcriptional regulator [Micromonospora sp. KC213]